MPTSRYIVKRIAGLKKSERRAIAFLSSDTDTEINAEAEFNRLNHKGQMDMRARFDHWIDVNVFDKYYHGWPNDPGRKHCFVFKRQRDRFYGFLIHPKLSANPSFIVCVLVCHGKKEEWETDPEMTNICNRFRLFAAVITAVKKEFPEDKKGGKKWVN